MLKLNITEFDHVKRIVNNKNISCPTFVHSILDGYTEGTVYADARLPQSVLISTNAGLYFVAGETNHSDFNHFLFELYRQRKKENLRFTLFSSTEKWNDVINNQLKEKIKQLHRLSFTYNISKILDDKKVESSEYAIEKINAESIKKSLEFNQTYYKEYWGSISNFMEKGFGFCMLHHGKIISECTSIFSSKQFAEIDIVTHEAYRGQGLALTLAKIYIDHCLKNRLVPRWDCDVSNASSIKLAKIVGFIDPVEYSVFV
ncbi:hypothetical protein J2Z40_003552 [Cytobacillus eiseniae]|uniref:N-acetyltransferase domain-containing protein n=1 Tax=Cytobacillus eiseniae TaxID=762947 RepID=A0ABS4RKS9_9BACI|nr:GNAT family N-acetyltransferase [Cytobacillus eiseniae]MBP2242970.1 hypothetical protein [Cytobacillus eiseniae]